MKALNIFTIAIVFVASHACAQQSCLPDRQAFSCVSLDNYPNHNAISFTVPKETNAFQYRVLAGNDSTNLEIVGTMHPAGNSVLSRSYHYDIYQPQYNYYRIVLVGMDARTTYSPVISAKNHENHCQPLQNTPKVNVESTVVKN